MSEIKAAEIERLYVHVHTDLTSSSLYVYNYWWYKIPSHLVVFVIICNLPFTFHSLLVNVSQQDVGHTEFETSILPLPNHLSRI